METLWFFFTRIPSEVMTPLTTPIFDFHQVFSSLMTPTPTPSQVKTSLKDFSTDQKRHGELKRSKQEFLKNRLFSQQFRDEQEGDEGGRVQGWLTPSKICAQFCLSCYLFGVTDRVPVNYRNFFVSVFHDILPNTTTIRITRMKIFRRIK